MFSIIPLLHLQSVLYSLVARKKVRQIIQSSGPFARFNLPQSLAAPGWLYKGYPASPTRAQNPIAIQVDIEVGSDSGGVYHEASGAVGYIKKQSIESDMECGQARNVNHEDMEVINRRVSHYPFFPSYHSMISRADVVR